MRSFLKRIWKEAFSTKSKRFSSREEGASLAKIAVYDSLFSPPKIVEVKSENRRELMDKLATQIDQFSRQKGGSIPFKAIKEVVENLVHAFFKEVIATVFDGGNTIRLSDQGPGIKDKGRAFQPGFTTANQEAKGLIRGVGAGLLLAKEALASLGGGILIEDNLGQGTVVTLALPPQSERKPSGKEPPEGKQIPQFNLTSRQKKVLSLVTEMGSAGPAKIASELEIGLSSAYRDLVWLQKQGLVRADSRGKRSLTPEGTKYLDIILAS